MNSPLFRVLCLGVLAGAPAGSFADQATLTVLDDTCIVQDGGGNDNNFGGRVELLTSNGSTNGSNRRFGLLRFDVSSLAGKFATIDAMTLKLRLRNGGGRTVPTTGQTLDIFRIADANAGWLEGTGQSTPTPDPGVTVPDTATYRAKSDNDVVASRVLWAGSAGLNTVATDYFATALGSTATFNATSGYGPGTVISIPFTATEFTLTDMVNAWVTQGGTTNAGLLIRGRSGTANGQIFFDTNETTDAGAQPAQLVIDYTPAAQTAYQIWVQANTLTGADADPTSDPDFDETVNLLEFAIDGNPKSGISSGKMACRVADIAGEPALTFTLPVRNGAVFSGANSLTATKDDVEYIVRASADLSAWTLDVDEVTPALSAGLPALNDGWSYRTFRIAGPVSLRPKAYFQLGVNYVP